MNLAWNAMERIESLDKKSSRRALIEFYVEKIWQRFWSLFPLILFIFGFLPWIWEYLK
jgi:hypothetical protein